MKQKIKVMEEIKMTDLNSVNLGGRIVKDAAAEKTKSGLDIVRFSIAVNRNVKDGDKWTSKAIFVELALFGNYAVSMVKYLTKGTYVTVEGYLDMDSWTTQDGKKLSRLKVVPRQGGINPWVQGKEKSAANSSEPTVNPEPDFQFADEANPDAIY